MDSQRAHTGAGDVCDWYPQSREVQIGFELAMWIGFARQLYLCSECVTYDFIQHLLL